MVQEASESGHRMQTGDRPDHREGSRREESAGLGLEGVALPTAARQGPDTAPSHSWASVSPLWHWNKGDTELRARSPDPAPCCLKATGRGQGFPTDNMERERQSGLLLMPGGRGRMT